MLHISGFVQSKRSKENGKIFSGYQMISKNKKKVLAAKMAQFSSDFQVISKNKNKKGLRSKMAQFSLDFQVISNKKKKRQKKSSSVFSISMGPMKPSGPSHGPLQVNRLPKPHELPDWPLKSMGPGIIVPPLFPSRRLWS